MRDEVHGCAGNGRGPAAVPRRRRERGGAPLSGHACLPGIVSCCVKHVHETERGASPPQSAKMCAGQVPLLVVPLPFNGVSYCNPPPKTATNAPAMSAAVLLAAASASWTESGFPECKPAPACYGNRRAPHHGSLLNGAATHLATLHQAPRAQPCSYIGTSAACEQRSSTSGAVTRAPTGSPSTTTAPRTSRCSRRAA